MKAINHSDAASPTGTHPGAKQKTEMVFVYPQFNDVIKGYVEAFTFSLSTAYIRAYLAGKGLHTEQYLQNRPGTVRQCAREIIAMGADIIGFSCVDSTLYYSILVADAVKEIKPDAVIIFGGASHTLSDKFIMENHPSVDICCRGEGEETCFELIVKLRDKQDLDDISGITFRRDNQLVRTPPRPLREEGEKNCGLDFLPSPYLSGMIDFEKLQDNDLFQYSLLTARGCPHQCTYCTNTAMGHFKVRYHSVERVISEIKEMSKRVTPGQNIVIYDDAFTIHVKRAKAICRRIIEENLAHIGYECMTRIDKFDEELLQLLHQAGFKVVIFGLESSNPSILNTIKKARSQPAVNGDYRPEQRFLDTMKQNIAKVKAIGMGTGVSFILGLPGETKKEARETLDFVQSLNVDYCIHNFLDISRGTEIFETCGNYGIGMRPSPFILPPITEFAYDVFELTPLDISVNINLLETWNTEGVEMLLEMFGAWKTDITGGKTDGLHVFIETLPADENRLFQWLADIVPFNGIVFIVEDNWEKYSFENRLFSFAKSKM
ncbi:MAG: radical SAM protein, partial [bacterium]|nr:radical SAM protein [bacterium]